MGKVTNKKHDASLPRINDYLNDIRPAPTGTNSEKIRGGGFTLIDNINNVTKSPLDGKAQALKRSVVARVVSGATIPSDPTNAAKMFVKKYHGKDHTAQAGVAIKAAFDMCPEFVRLGKG